MSIYQQEAFSIPYVQQEHAILERSRVDPSEFAPIYECYFARIYTYCLRRVGRPELAEDLTSVIFTRALAGLDGYRGGSVAAWLFRIAHNAVANHYRDKRTDVALDDLVGTPADRAVTDAAIVEHLIAAESQQRLEMLIVKLPEDERNLLALKIVGGLSAKEIGIVLGKSEGAVRVAQHRIVQKLRSAYRRVEEE